MSLNMMIGNIGCGKSFLSSKLAKMLNAVVVNNDILVKMMAGGEYNNYDKTKKEVYQTTEDTLIETALKNGFSVVIDRTNMDIKRRQRFIEIGKKYAKEIVAYDFGEGDEKGLKRRIKKSNGVPASTWQGVFEFMKKSYTQSSTEEGFTKIIEAPKRFRFYAFDFDGTIVENKFPEIGEIIDGTVEKLNKIYEDVSNVIIVWTCRSGDYVNQMRKFLCDNKIPFDFINENPMVDFGSPKIFAHEYYDDRNICS